MLRVRAPAGLLRRVREHRRGHLRVCPAGEFRADPFFPVGNAKALAEEIPGATLLVLDGVGAELPSRAHAEVATAVLAHTAQ